MDRNAGLRATDWTGQSVGTENPGLSGTTGQVKTGNLIWKEPGGRQGTQNLGAISGEPIFFKQKIVSKV